MSKLTAVEVRAAFPQCAAVADEFRAVLGAGVRLKYASEGGRETGQRSEAGKAVTVKDIGLMVPVEPKRRGGKW